MTIGHNRTAVFGVASLLAVGMAAVIPGAALAANSVNDILNYKGADRQAMLEAGAKKEGAILVYATASQTQPVYAAVHKKYPFLKVRLFRGNTDKITRRVTEEFKANSMAAGAIETGVGGLKLMRDQNILQPFNVPKTTKSPHAAMLVLDFMLSKQGQKMRQDLGYVGTRPDMVDKARGLPSKIHHLDMRPNYDAEYKKWSALKKVFGKAKKRPKMKKK